jgi:hypothetical protein
MGWLILIAAVSAAPAQVADQVRRATITGSGGASGKCTIEVRVDISAEVDVYGDSGRLRTLAGQPATWTRMECSAPLPYTMSDFRFRGIDGRGNVRLLQDPRNNNAIAVIRIDDPRSGAEGYTFDIEWSGASGGYATDGFRSGVSAQSAAGTGSAAQTPAVVGNRGVFYPGRGRNRNLSAEQAIDLCRTEVRARSERDYGLRNIDITSAAVDTDPGMRDWITGAFNAGSGSSRRGAGYRFHCAVDYTSGQVRAVKITRADGSLVQPLSAGSAQSSAAAGSYNQNQVFRACQDAVVARANRDGYQNVTFASTAMDPQRNAWVSGAITASRGPVTDTFDFGCSMDLTAARVLNLQLNRR